VVRGDGLADLFRFAVLLGQLDAELGVGAFGVPIDGLADVVEQAGPQGDVRVEADLAGHHGREHGHLLGVLEDVLAVARPVLELAQELDELRVDVADLELQDGRFALLLDLLLELGLDRLDDVLDAGRVDAAVGDELLDGQPGELAADGVEARQDDRLGRVVDDDVDARGHLQGPDVAALAADDPALHVVRREIDDRDRGLDDVLGRRPLDGVGHDLAGRRGRLLPGLLLDPPDGGDGLELGLLLDPPDQLGLGLFLGHAGDLLQLGHGLLDGLGDLGLFDLEVLLLFRELALLLGEIALLALDRLEPPLEVLLLAEEPALGLVDLALLLPGVGLELVQAGQVLLAGVDGRFPLDLLPFLPGLVEDHPGLVLGLDGLAGALLPFDEQNGDRRQENDDDGERGVRDRIHGITSSSIRMRRREGKRGASDARGAPGIGPPGESAARGRPVTTGIYRRPCM
jgi:hypothetical protein